MSAGDSVEERQVSTVYYARTENHMVELLRVTFYSFK